MARRRLIVQSRHKTRTAQVLVFLVDVLKPLFLVVGFVFRAVYRVFFAWWLNPMLKRAEEQSFAEDIKRAAPFLFDQYRGRIVPCPRPDAHDPRSNYICIATRNLVFEFCRWHGEIQNIRVSPLFSPNDSFDLLDTLLAADPGAQSVRVVSWHQFTRLLEPRIDLLEAALNRENFEATRNKLLHL
jgi:hypothetical protein